METRYCIEYVSPRHPLRDNGSINVRYDRVLTLEQAVHDLTLILSFGVKILNLYMGNVVDGKTGEWSPIPMIVDKDDWFTIDWLKSIEGRVQPQQLQWSDEDEENLQHCCLAISVDSLHTYEDKQDMEAWLKSLKERIRGE